MDFVPFSKPITTEKYSSPTKYTHTSYIIQILNVGLSANGTEHSTLQLDFAPLPPFQYSPS